MRDQAFANQRTFGRRANATPVPARVVSEAKPPTEDATKDAKVDRKLGVTEVTWKAVTAESSSDDEELRAWKEARKRSGRIPWRQISFTASACFGIASLALPDSTNNVVDWVLYALMAASFCAGLSKRWNPQ